MYNKNFSLLVDRIVSNIYQFFKENAKTGIADVRSIELGVTVRSIILRGCLKTARNHVISVQFVNLKLLVSFL